MQVGSCAVVADMKARVKRERNWMTGCFPGGNGNHAEMRQSRNTTVRRYEHNMRPTRDDNH